MRNFSEVGNGAKDVEGARGDLLARDKVCNLCVQFSNLAFHLQDPGLGLAPQYSNILCLSTVVQPGAALDQPAAGDVQILENARSFRTGRLR